MPSYNTPREVLERISELRRSHATLRAEIAVQCALGLAYANGRQWQTYGFTPPGAPFVDTWDEDWNPKSKEIRVTDNRIGPLVRRIAASTNATRVEASVQPSRHRKSIEASRRAATGQDVLNGLDEDAGMTVAARNASSLRWKCGSALLLVSMSKKQKQLGPEFARHPDGSPIEINDQWVRWECAPLTDLIWDPSNTSSDLLNHNVLLVERVLTVRQFEQQFGSLEKLGIDKDTLPTVAQAAPYYVAAAGIAGTSIFTAFAQQSREKAIRVMFLSETDPRDPTSWPTQYIVYDTSGFMSATSDVSGVVMNMDNPRTCYGHHGRNVFKLDAYRRDDCVWSFGVPHVLMDSQDMSNIATSLQFQQMNNVAHGYWLLDVQTAKREEFISDLMEGVGGVLQWDSKQQPNLKPPTWETPQAPNTEWINITSSLQMGMRDKVHISSANLGVGKTHIPEDVQRMLLQEAGIVTDQIVGRDADTYSEALKVTLGSVRYAMDSPNRMLARLVDKHGFEQSDLNVFLEFDPVNLGVDVRVRESSIITRSVDERSAELGVAVERQAITPQQYAIAMSEELERPIVRSHMLQLQFIRSAVIQIIDGREWPGLPSIDFGMFKHVAQQAMWGMDMDKPQDVEAIARLEAAIEIQRQIMLEQASQIPQEGGPSGPPPAEELLPDMRGLNTSPPESINPVTNPVGASGGLPLGLPSVLN